MVVHIDQRPYGTIRYPLAFRKILDTELRQSHVHSILIEKADVIGATQEYDLTS